MIRQIHIENYKALRDVTLDLTPFHVLIGPNDSGKTSILDATAALCRSADEPEDRWFVGEWEGLDLVWQGQPEAVSISAELTNTIGGDVPSLPYMVRCEFAGAGKGFASTRRSRILGHEIGIGNAGHQINLGLSDEVVQRTTALRTAQTEPYQEIKEAISGVRYYRFNPRQLAQPAARNSDVRYRLTPSGFGLPILLEDLREAHLSGYLRMLDRLKNIFPDIKDIKSEPVIAFSVEWRTLQQGQEGQQADDSDKGPAGGIRRSAWGKNILFEFASQSKLVPASQVSDGILLVVAYLAILNLPKLPRVILIEEPENGIYPKLLPEVVKILRDLVSDQSHSQIVMTTHSPYVLDEFKPEEVTLCRKNPDGSISVHPLPKSEVVKNQIDIFSLGEIWTGESEDKLTETEAPAEEPAK